MSERSESKFGDTSTTAPVDFRWRWQCQWNGDGSTPDSDGDGYHGNDRAPANPNAH